MRGKRQRTIVAGDRRSEPTSIKDGVTTVVKRLAGDKPINPVVTRIDELAKEADALRARILEGMPTRDEMGKKAHYVKIVCHDGKVILEEMGTIKVITRSKYN